MGMRDISRAIIVCALLGGMPTAWANPDRQMSMPNSFSNGTTADATQVNDNFNETVTEYNSHTHTDLSSATTNTFTIGDGAAGNKSYAINNSFTTDPSIRYNLIEEDWEFTNDASTFNNFANINQTTFTVGNGTSSNIAYAIDNSFTTDPAIRYNLTNERFEVSNNGSSFVPLLEDTKCANINPNSAETNWFIWKAPRAVTIREVNCIVEAATSVVLTPQECDSNGGTCSNITSAITCAATNTTGGVTNSSIDANDWIRVTRGTLTGTIDQAMICLTYTVD